MIKETSDLQKQTSRQNGALSRGPKTEEGKRHSSRNSLRHGLFAKAIVMDNECKEGFTTLIGQYRDSLLPEDAIEEGIVQEMAASFWRMRRAWAIETNSLNQNLPYSNPQDPSLAPQDGPAPGSDQEFMEEVDRITASWNAVAGTREFYRLQQREGELHRIFQRGIRVIMQLRAIRKMKNQQNEPEDFL